MRAKRNKQTYESWLPQMISCVAFSWTMDFHIEENAFHVCNIFATFIHYNTIKSNWITLFHSIKWVNSKWYTTYKYNHFIFPISTDWLTLCTQTTNLWMNNILNWNLNRMRIMNRAKRSENSIRMDCFLCQIEEMNKMKGNEYTYI